MLSASTTALIFRGLAILAIIWLIVMIKRARAVQTWSSVFGTILESRVETDADKNYFPYVRYSYVVSGREYIGSRILPHGKLATTGNYAERKVAEYQAGRKVRVYVNPSSAEDSALERSVPLAIYIMIVVAIFAFWWMGGMFETGFKP